MKKSKAIYFLIFAFIVSIIALICSVNIILNLISGAGADEVVEFYNNLSTLILSAAVIINAAAGMIISIILMVKKEYKTCAVIALTACICSLIAVLAAFLI